MYGTVLCRRQLQVARDIAGRALPRKGDESGGMTRLNRKGLAVLVISALAADGLGMALFYFLGVPLYSIQMALIVIAILVPVEFVAVAASDSLKKRRVDAKRGILPSRAKIR